MAYDGEAIGRAWWEVLVLSEELLCEEVQDDEHEKGEEQSFNFHGLAWLFSEIWDLAFL